MLGGDPSQFESCPGRDTYRAKRIMRKRYRSTESLRCKLMACRDCNGAQSLTTAALGAGAFIMMLRGDAPRCQICFSMQRSRSMRLSVRRGVRCSANGASKQTTIHKLIEQQKTLLIPGVHDALSAKVLAHTGHVSAFVSGYAVSNAQKHAQADSQAAFRPSCLAHGLIIFKLLRHLPHPAGTDVVVNDCPKLYSHLDRPTDACRCQQHCWASLTSVS